MEIFQELSQCVQRGDITVINDLVQSALDQDIKPAEILEKGLILGMKETGEKFKAGEIFVPEMLIAARAMNHALAFLEPKMVKGEIQSKGKVVMGTVQGDLHDIGKNLVGIMLKGAGYEVIDAGVDVPPEKFLELAQENQADMIGLSALLTTTLSNMKNIIDHVKGANSDMKIMIGGAPVTDEYAQKITADGYASNAGAAVDIADQLIA